MTAGGEVVEDYRHVGLTLRRHPVAFLRDDLRRAAHRHLRRGHAGARRPLAHGRRHRAGAAAARHRQGVMFITIEDETGIANLIVWPKCSRSSAG